jgi:hypothetical protein
MSHPAPRLHCRPRDLGRLIGHLLKCWLLIYGQQPSRDSIVCSLLLSVTTSLRQQSRDSWYFLEQTWIIHNRVEVTLSFCRIPEFSSLIVEPLVACLCANRD